MTQPEDVTPDLIGTGAQSIVEGAARLGLIWNLQLATVDSTISATTVSATYDADDTSINMVNITGTDLSHGQRVYAISVPPSGNFIVGFASQTAPYRDTIITTSSVASVTFRSIPSTLKEVRISYTARNDGASHTVGVYARINEDSSNLYDYEFLLSQNSGAPTAGFAVATNKIYIGECIAASASAGKYGGGQIVIPGWNSPHSTSLHMFGNAGALSQSTDSIIVMAYGAYFGTGSHTSITLLPAGGNFVAGSGFYLEGLR